MLLIVIDTSWQYVEFLIAFGMYCQLFIVAVFLSWRFIATHGTNNLVTRLSTVWYLHAHLLLTYVFFLFEAFRLYTRMSNDILVSTPQVLVVLGRSWKLLAVLVSSAHFSIAIGSLFTSCSS